MRLNLSKNLPMLRAQAISNINQQAEDFRAKFITLGEGQAMAYQQKKAEADAFLANTAINPAEIPHIAFEAELYGATLMEQAVLVVTKFYEWQTISALIERARSAANARVKAAANPTEIDAALEVDWSEVLALAN